MRLRIEENIGEMFLFSAKIESESKEENKGEGRSLKWVFKCSDCI